MKEKLMPMALLFVILAIAVFPTPAARARDAAPRRIVIIVKRFSYDPGEITLRKGQPVVIVLKSEDVEHGLRFRDFHFNLKVKGHSTAEAAFTPDKTGDFVGHCSVFCGSGHGSLVLQLHVVE